MSVSPGAGALAVMPQTEAGKGLRLLLGLPPSQWLLRLAVMHPLGKPALRRLLQAIAATILAWEGLRWLGVRQLSRRRPGSARIDMNLGAAAAAAGGAALAAGGPAHVAGWETPKRSRSRAGSDSKPPSPGHAAAQMELRAPSPERPREADAQAAKGQARQSLSLSLSLSLL